jgi:hypothetical protein
LTITVGVFSIVAGLLIGLLGALLFIVTAVGFALIILLPILFFTTLVATFIWLWGTGTYYILKYFNQKEIPGIHTDLKSSILGGSSEGSENDKLSSLNHKPDYEASEKKRQSENNSEGGEGKKQESKANGTAKKGQGQPLKQVSDNVGKSTGVDVGNTTDGITKKADVNNATKNVGDVKGKVDGATGGVTKNLPVGV